MLCRYVVGSEDYRKDAMDLVQSQGLNLYRFDLSNEAVNHYTFPFPILSEMPRISSRLMVELHSMSPFWLYSTRGITRCLSTMIPVNLLAPSYAL